MTFVLSAACWLLNFVQQSRLDKPQVSTHLVIAAFSDKHDKARYDVCTRRSMTVVICCWNDSDIFVQNYDSK